MPLARETFQLVVPTATLHTPAVQALLQVLSAPTLRLELSRLPGYDATSCGQAVCTLSADVRLAGRRRHFRGFEPGSIEDPLEQLVGEERVGGE